MAESDEDGTKVEPEKGYGDGGGEEEENGALQRKGNEVPVAGTIGLAAEWFQTGCEADENRVAGDIGEADR